MKSTNECGIVPKILGKFRRGCLGGQTESETE
jgi:hypothetical protein